MWGVLNVLPSTVRPVPAGDRCLVYGTVSEQLLWEVLVGRSHILGPLTIGEPGGTQVTFSTQACGVENPLCRSPNAFLVFHGAIILRLVQP